MRSIVKPFFERRMVEINHFLLTSVKSIHKYLQHIIGPYNASVKIMAQLLTTLF